MESSLRKTLATGCFSDVSPVRSRTMSAIRGKHNHTTEVRFRMALIRSALRGWVTHVDLPGKPDFYFPAANLAVFLDGCFWHGCKHCGHIPKTNSLFWGKKIELTQIRDRKNSRELRKRGLVVIRVWEHSLRNPKELQTILEKIQSLLTTRMTGPQR